MKLARESNIRAIALSVSAIIIKFFQHCLIICGDSHHKLSTGIRLQHEAIDDLRTVVRINVMLEA
jgi:hypothetical protein